MLNLKKSLPRRAFLKGAGATISLPLLSAMVPSLTALGQTAASCPKRVGFVYVPHGMVMTDKVDWWTPTTVGRNFEMTRTLEPLGRHRANLTIVSNLMGADGSGQHTGAATAWLTDSYTKPIRGADVEAGTSIDQLIARRIGRETWLPSMQVAIEDINSLIGSPDTGASCAYLNTVSWASATSPLPMQIDPRAVFERMFGASRTPDERHARGRHDRSILDVVLDDARRLDRTLGPEDRSRVDEFMASVREAERRIALAELGRAEGSSFAPASAAGIPHDFAEHVEIMFDLLHLAYQADITRVFTFMLAREQSHLCYPEIDVPDSHHAISHHKSSPETMQKLEAVNRYHLGFFARFLDRLAATSDGDGTLLDHSLLMYGSGMSDGDQHVKRRLPIAIVSGFVAGDRHIVAPGLTKPIGDLHVDIAKQLGFELERFGQRSRGGTVGLG